MTKATFQATVDNAFAKILERAQPTSAVAEQRGNLLTLRFESGHRATFTRQDSIEQVWLANGPLTWQFELTASGLVDTVSRDGIEIIVGRVLADRGRAPRDSALLSHREPE